MPDLFKEIVPSILQTKKNVFEDDPDLKDYNPFIINRALSFHPDCIPYVEEMKDRKSTRLNSSHSQQSRMPSSA